MSKPEDTKSETDENEEPELTPEAKAEQARIAEENAKELERRKKENADLRAQLKAMKETQGVSDADTTGFDAIVDADIEGGVAAAPELPVYKEGETKTFTLRHEMVNVTPDGVKRYKPDVRYTLLGQSADDLIRRDKEHQAYQDNIHVRQTLIRDIGTISGNG